MVRDLASMLRYTYIASVVTPYTCSKVLILYFNINMDLKKIVLDNTN